MMAVEKTSQKIGDIVHSISKKQISCTLSVAITTCTK